MSDDPIKQMLEAKVILAPMAGITDVPFRLLARRYGCRFAFTEMIDVNGVIYNNRKTFELMKRLPGDAPLGLQLVGQDEEKIARVARYGRDLGYGIIDVNAGCPARKVVAPGKGAALLKDPEKLGRIVGRLTKELDIPVIVKIRAGWDSGNRNYLKVGEVVRKAGASALCLHARTKEQMYRGKADHDMTRELKGALDMPVFASGNIFSAGDAIDITRYTGCDGVYIARGALGKPWVFRDFYSRIAGVQEEDMSPLYKAKNVIREHYDLCLEYFGEERVVSRMYKHIAWYLKGYRNLNEIMNRYREATGPEAFRAFLKRLDADDRKSLFLK